MFAGVALLVADVQHPQHVLDPRRPAHAGIGAAASDRCVACVRCCGRSAPKAWRSASWRPASGSLAGVGLAIRTARPDRVVRCRAPDRRARRSRPARSWPHSWSVSLVTFLASVVPAIKGSRGRSTRGAARERDRPQRIIEVARRVRRARARRRCCPHDHRRHQLRRRARPEPGSGPSRRWSAPSPSARSSPVRAAALLGSPLGGVSWIRPARSTQRDAQPAPHVGHAHRR